MQWVFIIAWFLSPQPFPKWRTNLLMPLEYHIFSLYTCFLAHIFINSFPGFVKAHGLGWWNPFCRETAISLWLLRTHCPCKWQVSCRVTTVQCCITIQDFPIKVAYGYLFNRKKITPSKNIYDLCASYRKQF